MNVVYTGCMIVRRIYIQGVWLYEGYTDSVYNCMKDIHTGCMIIWRIYMQGLWLYEGYTYRLYDCMKDIGGVKGAFFQLEITVVS